MKFLADDDICDIKNADYIINNDQIKRVTKRLATQFMSFHIHTLISCPIFQIQPQIPTHFPNLLLHPFFSEKKIPLPYPSQDVSYIGVENILPHCRLLSHLTLQSCFGPYPPPPFTSSLSTYAIDLVKLKLQGGFGAMSDCHLAMMVECCGKLKSVSLFGCGMLTSGGGDGWVAILGCFVRVYFLVFFGEVWG